jgi:hypothetical protein
LKWGLSAACPRILFTENEDAVCIQGLCLQCLRREVAVQLFMQITLNEKDVSSSLPFWFTILLFQPDVSPFRMQFWNYFATIGDH